MPPGRLRTGCRPGPGPGRPTRLLWSRQSDFDVLLQIFQNAVHDLPVAGGVLSAALEDLQRGLGSLQHVQVGHHVLAAELAGIVRVRLPGSGDGRLALQRNRADSGDPFYHRQGGLRIEEGVVGIRRGCNQGFLRIRQVLICRPGGYNGILAPGADFSPIASTRSLNACTAATSSGDMLPPRASTASLRRATSAAFR